MYRRVSIQKKIYLLVTQLKYVNSGVHIFFEVGASTISNADILG